MDHLPWYESSNIDPVSVPFLCSNRPLCGKAGEFFDFPPRQGWELNKSESLDQLAERAQAWLFFGLLALAGIAPDTCIEPESSNTGDIGDTRERAVITASFSDLLRFSSYEDPILPQLIPAISQAESVMLGQVIPFIQEYEALESLHLWNSKPYAVLFSIDILLDTFKDSLSVLAARRYPIVYNRPHISDEPEIQEEPRDPDHTAVAEQSSAGEDSSIPTHPSVPEQSSISEQLCPEASEEASVFNESTFSAAFKTLRSGYSFFPKLTEGIPQSLFHAGRCGSLAHRLDWTSSQFYYLMSLPNGPNNEDHSQCSKTSCNCFSVDQTTYRTRHTRDCIMCEDASVVESRLVGLIQNDEVPIIRSTMDRNGHVTVLIEKLTPSVDYAAISHVWAGGLGNFNANQLPQCQLQAIHRDVCQTMTKAFNEMLNEEIWAFYGWSYPSFLKPREPGGKGILSLWPASTTCYYWMDTLCIPNNHPNERREAINSMGRIYAGASAVLILDPALSSIGYDALGATTESREERANLLVQASPWMARSWPLQEAALASELYVKFADGSVHYEQEHLGISATLGSIPNQDLDGPQLRWTTFQGLPTIWMEEEEYFATGDASPYTSDGDFVKVWNLLVKRTTSYQVDVPAIFATLLYKSASKLLSIEPACRTWALLGTMKSLPLDILCVEQEPQRQPGQWTPRLPGSSRPVPTLDTTYGLLQRVPGGFVLNLSETPTHALICPNGLSVSGGHFILHDGHSLQSYIVHIPASSDATSKDKFHHVRESQLILMLPKGLPGSSSTNYGVLCKINSQTENTVRAQPIHNAITWRSISGQEQLPAHDTRNVLFLDPFFSVYLEMGK
jgi:hypothetical protein